MSSKLDDINEPGKRARIQQALGTGGGSPAHSPEPQPVRASFEIRPTTDEAKLNKTERAFLAYLRSLPECFVGIQNVTLKLGDDCRYTPDFWAVLATGKFTFYEVKGFWRDDARVKIKTAARMFRWARFVAVQQIKAAWKMEEIKP